MVIAHKTKIKQTMGKKKNRKGEHGKGMTLDSDAAK